MDAASQEEIDRNTDDILGIPWNTTAEAKLAMGDKRKEKV